MPDQSCSIEGCDSPVKSRGWCRKHYLRWHRHGSPYGSASIPEDLEERFRSKVEVRDDGCHIWVGSRLPRGYGRFGREYAHRFGYELAKGPIPEGLQIDHLCRNTSCVNPDHLEAVTPLENNRRMREVTPLPEACPNGHPYEGDNLYVNGKGARECRTCRHDAQRRHWAREAHEEIERLRAENERLCALLQDADRGRT